MKKKCKGCGLELDSIRFYKGASTCRGCNYKDCEQCGESFANNSSLRAHYRAVHLGIKKWQCDHCPYKVANRSNLTTHKCYAIKNGVRTPMMEKDVQLRLEGKYRGWKKQCEVGEIDLMTDDFIMEIKHWVRWKEAIGKILCYGLYFPSHEKRIHLFGAKPKSGQVYIIKQTVSQFNITLSWE